MDTYSIVNGRKVVYSSNSFDNVLDAVRQLTSMGYRDLYYVSVQHGRLVFMDFLPGDEDLVFHTHDIEIMCAGLAPRDVPMMRKLLGWPFVPATAHALVGQHAHLLPVALNRIREAKT